MAAAELNDGVIVEPVPNAKVVLCCPLPKHFNVSSILLKNMAGFSEIFGSKKCCILDGGLVSTFRKSRIKVMRGRRGRILNF